MDNSQGHGRSCWNLSDFQLSPYCSNTQVAQCCPIDFRPLEKPFAPSVELPPPCVPTTQHSPSPTAPRALQCPSLEAPHCTGCREGGTETCTAEKEKAGFLVRSSQKRWDRLREGNHEQNLLLKHSTLHPATLTTRKTLRCWSEFRKGRRGW